MMLTTELLVCCGQYGGAPYEDQCRCPYVITESRAHHIGRTILTLGPGGYWLDPTRLAGVPTAHAQ